MTSRAGPLPGARLRKSRGGLLRSLLCCIGRGQASRSPSPSPAPEEPAPAAAAQPSAGVGIQQPPDHLLPPVRHQDMGKVCLVVDLDETLVHSSFKVRTTLDVRIFFQTFSMSLFL